MHSLRQLERSVTAPSPLPQVWLLIMSHSKINKSVHVQSFPTRINRTHAQSHMHNMHTDTHPPIHTQHTSHCSERGFSTLALKDTLPHPTLFQIGNTLSWLWCLHIPPFLACAGQVYSSENNMQCLHCRIIIQLGPGALPARPKLKLSVKRSALPKSTGGKLGARYGSARFSVHK